ncbi:hypothetical protein [Psychrobacter sp. 16-MNA-CIBAN-0192]|uniref:hypothetical protein n=1 Tax=Psychrobacter sp. 16-MNA-CIBAN-0192 TaxID=3140448 RepID=UPI003328ED63
MNINSRTYTEIATTRAKRQLQDLLDSNSVPAAYRKSMIELGKLLADAVSPSLENKSTLIVSTAEDADYLQFGVSSFLKSKGIDTKLAVFWNHHYQLSNSSSVAPIVHKFIEPGYKCARNIIVVKSVMSGSCVVRTNLIEMLDEVKRAEHVFILSPVAHKNSEEKLKNEFPKHISDKFKFFCFAIDDKRDVSGEVIPGIGGQIYDLLGLSKQPVLSSYMPKVVEELVF